MSINPVLCTNTSCNYDNNGSEFLARRLDIDSPSSSIKTASIAQLGSKIVNVVTQLVITMVLARILTPAEYGTVAVLQVFSSLFNIFADAGISTAIAQSQELDKEDYSRLFFLSLLIGVALAIGYFILSIGVAWFYADLIYIPLGAVMMLAVIFNALNMVPNGLLIKERKFKLIGARLIVCTIVVGILAIIMAVLGLGCYAIALNSVLSALFVLIWNVSKTKLNMSIGSVKDVLHKVGSFSAYNLGNGLIGWFATNIDSLIVGKLFGSAALGYYNKAYELYSYPLNILTVPITNTILPFLAPLQDDLEAMRAKFLDIFKKVSFISAFCTVAMHVCATEVILILFGNNWTPSIPLLEILAFAIYSRGINASFSSLLNATGHPELLMRSTAINTIITLSMITVGAFTGSIETLSILIAISYNIEILIPIYYSAHDCLHLSIHKFMLSLVPDIASGAATVVITSLIPWGIPNVFFSVIIKGIIVALVMLTLRVLLERALFNATNSK